MSTAANINAYATMLKDLTENVFTVTSLSDALQLQHEAHEAFAMIEGEYRRIEVLARNSKRVTEEDFKNTQNEIKEGKLRLEIIDRSVMATWTMANIDPRKMPEPRIANCCCCQEDFAFPDRGSKCPSCIGGKCIECFVRAQKEPGAHLCPLCRQPYEDSALGSFKKLKIESVPVDVDRILNGQEDTAVFPYPITHVEPSHNVHHEDNSDYEQPCRKRPRTRSGRM